MVRQILAVAGALCIVGLDEASFFPSFQSYHSSQMNLSLGLEEEEYVAAQ